MLVIIRGISRTEVLCQWRPDASGKILGRKRLSVGRCLVEPVLDEDFSWGRVGQHGGEGLERFGGKVEQGESKHRALEPVLVAEANNAVPEQIFISAHAEGNDRTARVAGNFGQVQKKADRIEILGGPQFVGASAAVNFHGRDGGVAFDAEIDGGQMGGILGWQAAAGLGQHGGVAGDKIEILAQFIEDGFFQVVVTALNSPPVFFPALVKVIYGRPGGRGAAGQDDQVVPKDVSVDAVLEPAHDSTAITIRMNANTIIVNRDSLSGFLLPYFMRTA